MAKLGEILADIIGSRKKDAPPRRQLSGPIRPAPRVIAVCDPCTQIHRLANPKFEGKVGWPANDLERHLREYHLVGQL